MGTESTGVKMYLLILCNESTPERFCHAKGEQMFSYLVTETRLNFIIKIKYNSLYMYMYIKKPNMSAP